MRNMDYEKFRKELEIFRKNEKDMEFNELDGPHSVNDDWATFDKSYLKKADPVNSPAHYTRGRMEAIDIIEDAVQDAPDPVTGMLQAQVLKYLLRLWVKENPTQDAEKANWYLNRLINNLNCHD